MPSGMIEPTLKMGAAVTPKRYD